MDNAFDDQPASSHAASATQHKKYLRKNATGVDKRCNEPAYQVSAIHHLIRKFGFEIVSTHYAVNSDHLNKSVLYQRQLDEFNATYPLPMPGRGRPRAEPHWITMRRRKLDRLVMAARERAYKKGPGHTSWVIRDPVTDTLVVNRRPTHEVFYKLRVMAYDRFDADWVGLYDDAKLYRVRRWAKLACARVRSRHPKEGEDALVFEVLGNDAVRGEYGRITPSCLARLLGGEAPARADGWLTEGEIRRVMRQSGLWIVCPVQWAFAKRWAVLMEYEPGDKPLPSLEERRAQRQPRAQVLRYAD